MAPFFTGSAAMLSIIALASIYFGHLLTTAYFDGAASILTGALLVGIAVFMLREVKGLLVDEGASETLVRDLDALARQDSVVQYLHALSRCI